MSFLCFSEQLVTISDRRKKAPLHLWRAPRRVSRWAAVRLRLNYW